MYLEVYPDVIFALNFFMDFVILSLLKKVNRKSGTALKRAAAAAFGAVGAVIAGINPWMNIFIRFILMNVVVASLMLSVSFGKMKKADFLKQLVSLYLITYFIGGLINSIYYNTGFRLQLIQLGKSTVFSNVSGKFVVVVIWIMVPASLIISRKFRLFQYKTREIFEIELIQNQRTVRTKGFLDSGNCLYDPIFKKPVIIIEYDLMKELLSPIAKEEFDKIKSGFHGAEDQLELWNYELDQGLRIRLIPYRSIGKPQGMMLGIVLDQILIHQGKEILSNEKVTAAICDNHLSAKDEYHVILHKELI